MSDQCFKKDQSGPKSFAEFRWGFERGVVSKNLKSQVSRGRKRSKTERDEGKPRAS